MTPTPRSHRKGKDTFFGGWFYKNVIQENHLPVGLKRLIEWEALTGQLIELYQREGLRGRPPYRPSLVFEMLCVSYLYGVSEREVQELARYHLAIKWFLGSGRGRGSYRSQRLDRVQEPIDQGGIWGALEEVYDAIPGEAGEQGIELGNI